MNELMAVKASAGRLEAELAELKEMMQAMTLAKPAKQPKIKAEPSGEPKEKRAPSAYITFYSKEVIPVIRALEAETQAEKVKVGVLTQFAGFLWKQRHEWSAEEIKEAWPTYTPPEESKQSVEGKNKRSGSVSGSGDEAEPEADAEAPKKVRKPQSEETKKAAAAKRAATKAAKAALPAPMVGGGAESEPAEAEAEAAVATPAKPVKKITPKPKKVVDILLDAWEHDGTEYLKNERGDVLSSGGEWVGHWNGTELDTDAPEPADFDRLTTRD